LIKKEQCTLRLIHQFSARFTLACRLPFLSFVERANFSLTRKLIWRLFPSVFISLDGILLRRLQSRFFSSRFNACTQGERGRERRFWREAEKKVNDGAQKKPEEFLPGKATLVLSQQGIISLLTSAEKNRRLPRKKAILIRARSTWFRNFSSAAFFAHFEERRRGGHALTRPPARRKIDMEKRARNTGRRRTRGVEQATCVCGMSASNCTWAVGER
jgi:hypothetical protein